MELAKVTSRGQITLPLAIRRKLDVKEGDKVVFYEENGRIVIENAAKLTIAQEKSPASRNRLSSFRRAAFPPPSGKERTVWPDGASRPVIPVSCRCSTSWSAISNRSGKKTFRMT